MATPSTSTASTSPASTSSNVPSAADTRPKLTTTTSVDSFKPKLTATTSVDSFLKPKPKPTNNNNNNNNASPVESASQQPQQTKNNSGGSSSSPSASLSPPTPTTLLSTSPRAPSLSSSHRSTSSRNLQPKSSMERRPSVTRGVNHDTAFELSAGEQASLASLGITDDLVEFVHELSTLVSGFFSVVVFFCDFCIELVCFFRFCINIKWTTILHKTRSRSL